ncbi:MAG: ArsC/Spx/MgsR family protein [Bacteroidota bacterium]
MKTHQREILIYYNPDSSADRRTVAHAKGMVPHIRSYAHHRSPSGGTSWHQIIRSLGMHPKEMLNKAHPDYQKNIRGKEFDEEGWMNILRHNPQMIKYPIAVRGRKAVLCSTPTDVYRLVDNPVRPLNRVPRR